MRLWHWWNDTDGGKQLTGEVCHSASLLTSYLTWTGLGSNPGFYREVLRLRPEPWNVLWPFFFVLLIPGKDGTTILRQRLELLTSPLGATSHKT